jgi:transposase
VRALAPILLDEPGVGPLVAAQLIITWSRPGRLRSEACFARFAGEEQAALGVGRGCPAIS